MTKEQLLAGENKALILGDRVIQKSAIEVIELKNESRIEIVTRARTFSIEPEPPDSARDIYVKLAEWLCN